MNPQNTINASHDDILLLNNQFPIIIQLSSSVNDVNHIHINQNIAQTASLAIGNTVDISKLSYPISPCHNFTIQATFEHPPDYFPDSFLIYVKESLLDMMYITQNMIFHISFNGKLHRFKIIHCNSLSSAIVSAPRIYRINKFTRISLKAFDLKKSNSLEPISYSSIGGLSLQIEKIKKLLHYPLNSPETFKNIGLDPPKGLLLYGPPGTGKTLIAKAVAFETKAHVLVINGSEIISKFYGETEENLRKIFQEAHDNAPSIIFIDEIDALCPKRDDANSELEKRAVATLLTLMDGSSETVTMDRVVVLGATNRPNSLDEALRRPGRFDLEIEIGIPNALDRLDILQRILSNIPNKLSEKEIEDIAFATHGYVGADISALCREAGIIALRSFIRQRNYEKSLLLDADLPQIEKLSITNGEKEPKTINNLDISFSDIENAMTMIKPSAMREIFLEIPKVKWEDIGGQHEIKQKLKEAVEWPLKHPEIFSRFKIKPPKGILLYGPPGCSKTLMAKALATEAGLNFIAIKGPELFSKYVGDSEKAVQQVFKRARAASPSIIFFDEIDAIGLKREVEDSSVGNRVLSQLLNEMDGIEALVNVTIVAATNRPDILDCALLRPGRIDRILYVSPPDLESRKQIIKIQISRMTLDTDVDLDKLSIISDGYSGAECVYLCQEAGFEAMQENIDAESVSMRHFLISNQKITPRISPDMILFYDNFRRSCGLNNL